VIHPAGCRGRHPQEVQLATDSCAVLKLSAPICFSCEWARQATHTSSLSSDRLALPKPRQLCRYLRPAHQHGTAWKPRVREIFKQGELGLVGLILAASVIWDLQKSSFTFVTIAVGSILLALSGIMAANVWVETYCRKTTTTRHDPARSWRDSRNLALLVFSIAMVAETLLDRLAKVLPS
jgi:hypothetical protein